jgi:hypothetical protein
MHWMFGTGATLEIGHTTIKAGQFRVIEIGDSQRQLLLESHDQVQVIYGIDAELVSETPLGVERLQIGFRRNPPENIEYQASQLVLSVIETLSIGMISLWGACLRCSARKPPSGLVWR